MNILATIFGLGAVCCFLLCFQQRKRINIIILNTASRVLYILQYLLLGAISGAVLDVVGIVAAVLAGLKTHPKCKKYMKLLIPFVYTAFIVSGVLTYKTFVDIFPLVGVMLHTGALFLEDEKKIRILSLVGSPFWLTYNVFNLAVGSAIGDFLSICSILVALFRYDIPRRRSRSLADGCADEIKPTEDCCAEDKTNA